MENNTTKNSSNLPFVIIGIVLFAALIGGWWFYQNAKTPNKGGDIPKTPTPKSSPGKTEKEVYESGLTGANPPNMLGSPTAAVTVEEFADYQCPTCGTIHPKLKELTGAYGNKIKFIYRSFPLTQIHKNAYDSAVAAEAAGLQGKFWAMQDQLFENRTEWENSNDARKIFEGYAQKLGMDVAKFQNDMLGLPAKSRVDEDMKRGRSIGINGTPTIYIVGKNNITKLTPEQMEVAAMRQIIDAELQKNADPAQSNQPASNSNTVANQMSNSENKK